MRQWRVGSFSMGLILALLGIGLIIDRFSGTPKALELVVIWWPLALILLGAEILAVGFLSRNEQFKLKYDGWSILLVIVLFFFCLGSYALSYSGVVPQVREAISLAEYSCAIPDQEANLAGIKKVIITSREGDLTLHSVPGDKLTILGQAAIWASTLEAADKLAGEARVKLITFGDTLHVQINQVPEYRNIFRQRHSQADRVIFIPAGISLEITNPDFPQSRITLYLNSLAAPWSIDTAGPVRVNLFPELDLMFYGSACSIENLAGNTDWEYSSEENPKVGSYQKVSGKIRLGSGRWPLVISSKQDIEVNLCQDQIN